MSSTIPGSSRAPSATSPASTPSSSSSNGNSPVAGFSTASSFYRNLFYILVGVLVVFLVITFLSFIRTRRRRQMVEAEARRLGLLVPGMPGYLTERARLAGALRGEKKPAKDTPLMWDVASKESEEWSSGTTAVADRLGSSAVDYERMTPLALVPLLPAPPLGPIPISTLKFFPNSMAFRAPKPPVSAETVIKQWEEDLAPASTKQGQPAESQNRPRGRTRGKSLIDQYPQEHVPPTRLSIERVHPRKASRAAEFADTLGNKIFGHPRLPEREMTPGDLEAQVGTGGRSRANTGVEMTQIGATLNARQTVDDANTPHPHLRRSESHSIPPTVQLMTFVRMPIPETSRALVGKGTWHLESEEEQEKAVQSEWAGVVLGITEMEVVGDGNATHDVWGGSV
ncbi:hypothetical protein NCC49_001496 [Naganishia albida]|nr:hypothetical protein NCC49_001496 [Naganishia albida]